jgi:hypothetical protein
MSVNTRPPILEWTSQTFTELHQRFQDVWNHVNKNTSSRTNPLGMEGQYRSKLVTVPNSIGADPVIRVNWNDGNNQKVLLAHTGTALIILSNGYAGGRYTLILSQDGVGGHAVNLTIGGVRWVGELLPSQSLGADKKDVITLIHDGDDYLGTMSEGF